MRKKIAQILIAIFVLSIFSNVCFSLGYAGAMDISYSDYTEINSYEDLKKINNDLDGKYILTADIHMPDEPWTPIGSESEPFTGTFNGNNFAIIGFNGSFTANADTAFGFFGYIENAVVCDILLFADISIDTTIANAGLICGKAINSEIKDCLTYGTLNINVSEYAYVGGIVGYAYGNTANAQITNCVNNAAVSVSGNGKSRNLITGGVAGNASCAVTQCANKADISVTNSSETLSAYSAAAGGITGKNEASITDCYNIGNIEAVGTGFAFAGGITGVWYQNENIFNLYNTGKISAQANSTESGISQAYYGAIAGITQSKVELESLDNTKSDNSVSAANCYYLDNMEYAIGGEKNSENAKQLSTAEFKVKDSFTGFDFNNTWTFIDGANSPVLKAEKLKSVSSLTIKTGKKADYPVKNTTDIKTMIALNNNISVLDNGKIKGINPGEDIIVAITDSGEVSECYVTVEYSLFWLIVDLLFGWLM